MRTLASELGAHLDDSPHVPRVYVDANVPARLIEFMRTRLGWDVLAVIEHDDLRRASDEHHFRLARQMHRTLVSLDHDYLDDRRFPPRESGGIVVLTAPDDRAFVRLLRRLARDWARSQRGQDREPVGHLPLLGTKLHLCPEAKG